jgi:hypothetical protein
MRDRTPRGGRAGEGRRGRGALAALAAALAYAASARPDEAPGDRTVRAPSHLLLSHRVDVVAPGERVAAVAERMRGWAAASAPRQPAGTERLVVPAAATAAPPVPGPGAGPPSEAGRMWGAAALDASVGGARGAGCPVPERPRPR